MLLVFGAFCQRNLREGQEHGRTIPLSVSGGGISPVLEVLRTLGAHCPDRRPPTETLAAKFSVMHNAALVQ